MADSKATKYRAGWPEGHPEPLDNPIKLGGAPAEYLDIDTESSGDADLDHRRENLGSLRR